MTKLYVGNLPYSASETDLESWFAERGVTVANVTLVRDRFSGEARGFGFVEIVNESEANTAVESCNGKEMMGRRLVVNEARAKPQRAEVSTGYRRERSDRKQSRRREPRW